MTSIPHNVFAVVKTTDGSTNEWMLHDSGGTVAYGFDYATRVSNADPREKIALYGGDGGYMSVSLQSIDATVSQLNELLLDDCEPFDEADLEP